MKFEYPIQTDDPQSILGQKNTVGFYPIGRLFNWHGGLHVAERSYGPIKAIADGVIVAYRICKTAFITNNIKYSNGFVLAKHIYISPNGLAFNFFTLYNHLMPYDEMMGGKGLPPVFMENVSKVKKGNADKGKNYEGLKLRTNSATSNGRKIVACVPTGTVCKLAKGGTTPKGFIKVDYTSANGTQYKGHLLWLSNDKTEIANNKYVKVDETAGTVTVMSDEDVGRNGDVGLHLRSSASGKSDNNIIKVLPVGTLIKIHPDDVNKTSSYVRVVDVDGIEEEGFVYSDCIEPAKRNNFNSNDLDVVITGENCDLVINAGDVIGYAGLCGFQNQENLRTCHVEVLSDQDPTQFLKGIDGDIDDVKNTKRFAKIKKGAKLTLKYPITFNKDDEIEVLDFSTDASEEYCKVKLHKLIREVNFDDLKFKEQKKEGDTLIWAKYTPKHLSNLNKIFHNKLTKKSIIDWVESIEDKDGKRRRKVSFTVPSGDQVWVKKSTLGITAKPTQPIVLSSDLTSLYYKKPEQGVLEYTLEQDYLQKESELKAIKAGGNNEVWYNVKTLTPIKNEHGFVHYKTIEGLIKSDDKNIDLVSAHDWEVFGFKIFKDQSDEFVFNKTIKELKSDNAPKFLQSVWDHIDENGDGKLTNKELRNALTDPFAQQKLSKMVCYHQSEWGVDFALLKPEIETLLDEGIALEEGDKKQFLEDKKAETLKITEDKIKAFNFWESVEIPEISFKESNQFSEIKNLIPQKFELKLPDATIFKPYKSVSPFLQTHKLEVLELPEIPEIEVSYSKMPAQPKFWHFNPVAFVEQMRRMVLVSKEEARIRAYMRMLKVGEGTGEIIKSYDKKTNKDIMFLMILKKGTQQPLEEIK